MEFPENEIAEIKKFIDLLNSEKDGVVIVEGKRDSAALVKLGYSGKIFGISQIQWYGKIC